MYKQGNARGTSEVRRGTSSIHFHCPVPRSSSHIGHGKYEKQIWKMYENRGILVDFHIFFVFWCRECILGCILGLRGVLSSIGGAGNRRPCLEEESLARNLLNMFWSFQLCGASCQAIFLPSDFLPSPLLTLDHVQQLYLPCLRLSL